MLGWIKLKSKTSSYTDVHLAKSSTWLVLVLADVDEGDVHSGGVLICADEALGAAASAGHPGRPAEGKDDGSENGGLPTSVLAAQEGDPLVRHEGERLRELEKSESGTT